MTDFVIDSVPGFPALKRNHHHHNRHYYEDEHHHHDDDEHYDEYDDDEQEYYDDYEDDDDHHYHHRDENDYYRERPQRRRQDRMMNDRSGRSSGGGRSRSDRYTSSDVSSRRSTEEEPEKKKVRKRRKKKLSGLARQGSRSSLGGGGSVASGSQISSSRRSVRSRISKHPWEKSSDSDSSLESLGRGSTRSRRRGKFAGGGETTGSSTDAVGTASTDSNNQNNKHQNHRHPWEGKHSAAHKHNNKHNKYKNHHNAAAAGTIREEEGDDEDEGEAGVLDDDGWKMSRAERYAHRHRGEAVHGNQFTFRKAVIDRDLEAEARARSNSNYTASVTSSVASTASNMLASLFQTLNEEELPTNEEIMANSERRFYRTANQPAISAGQHHPHDDLPPPTPTKALPPGLSTMFRFNEEEVNDDFEDKRVKQGIETARKKQKTRTKTSYEVDAPRSVGLSHDGAASVRSTSLPDAGPSPHNRSGGESLGDFYDSDHSGGYDSLEELLHPERFESDIGDDEEDDDEDGLDGGVGDEDSVHFAEAMDQDSFNSSKFLAASSTNIFHESVLDEDLMEAEEVTDVDHAQAVIQSFNGLLSTSQRNLHANARRLVERHRAGDDLSLPSLESVDSNHDGFQDFDDYYHDHEGDTSEAMDEFLFAFIRKREEAILNPPKKSLTGLFRWSEKQNVDHAERRAKAGVGQEEGGDGGNKEEEKEDVVDIASLKDSWSIERPPTAAAAPPPLAGVSTLLSSRPAAFARLPPLEALRRLSEKRAASRGIAQWLKEIDSSEDEDDYDYKAGVKRDLDESAADDAKAGQQQPANQNGQDDDLRAAVVNAVAVDVDVDAALDADVVEESNQSSPVSETRSKKKKKKSSEKNGAKKKKKRAPTPTVGVEQDPRLAATSLVVVGKEEQQPQQEERPQQTETMTPAGEPKTVNGNLKNGVITIKENSSPSGASSSTKGKKKKKKKKKKREDEEETNTEGGPVVSAAMVSVLESDRRAANNNKIAVTSVTSSRRSSRRRPKTPSDHSTTTNKTKKKKKKLKNKALPVVPDRAPIDPAGMDPSNDDDVISDEKEVLEPPVATTTTSNNKPTPVDPTTTTSNNNNNNSNNSKMRKPRDAASASSSKRKGRSKKRSTNHQGASSNLREKVPSSKSHDDDEDSIEVTRPVFRKAPSRKIGQR